MARPPLIRDPRAVPVLRADDHLPALPPQQLLPPVLRHVFATAPTDWPPELPGDGGGPLAERTPAAAAVLVPLVPREDGLRVLLTRRTDHLRDHAGQISFPGGRVDPGETDPVVTALREAREEVGLDARHVEVIGALPVYTTVTAYRVTPVVALVHPPFELSLDAFEVAEAFEVPLQFLMTPAHHRIHQLDGDAGRRFLSMPWREGEREYFIWGATAAMLRNLYHFLARAQAGAASAPLSFMA